MKQVTEMTTDELKEEIENYRMVELEGMGAWSQRDIHRCDSILREQANRLQAKDAYSVKVDRPEELNDAQWEAFCELMDGEDFEGSDFWGIVDSLFREVMEDNEHE